MPATPKVSKQSKAPQGAPSRAGHPNTPPSSPSHDIGPISIPADQFERLMNLLERLVEGKSESGKGFLAAGSQDKGNIQPAEARTLASKLEFKTVDEVYVVSSTIATASLTSCLAVGIRLFPSIRL